MVQRIFIKIVQFVLVQLESDHYLFTMSYKYEFLVLVVYINDVLITGIDQNNIEEVKKFLHKEFTIKDLGHVDYFLGIELEQTGGEIYIS